MEEALHTLFILGLVRVHFGIDPFEVGIRDDCRGAMTRARDEEGIEVVFLDQAIEVNVGEALTGVRTPMTQQSGFV